MPARATDDDWSDSDEESVEGVESSVNLGVPDGAVGDPGELQDAAVSRIGGRPAFLVSKEVSLESSQCKNCSFPMELLVQMWCPVEDSPNDRALYIWGCARKECQKKAGSVRVWRGLRRNEKYAVKLEKQLARRREQEAEQARIEAERAQRESMKKVNPFSVGKSAKTNPFDMSDVGTSLFSSSSDFAQPESTEPEPDPIKGREEPADEPASDSESDSDEEVVAIASDVPAGSPWLSAPAYDPPYYLSTAPEYLPAPSSSDKKKYHEQDSFDEGKGKGGKDEMTWNMEGYENSIDLDHVFERFSTRVSYEGAQCVRYDFGGTPLPYCADDVFARLFPSPEPTVTFTPQAGSKATPPGPKRAYSPTSIPPCPACGGSRVFECQLMPNLINVLRPTSSASKADIETKSQTAEERKKEIERLLRGEGNETKEMGWGTCLIFSCEKDCCSDSGKASSETWREEYVLMQWEE